MIEFRKPQFGDLKKLRPKPVYKREPAWEDMVMHHELSDMWSVFHGEQLLVIIGFSQIWEGVARVWAVVGEDIDQHGVAATLALRRFIQKQAKERRVHRVQMAVQSQYTQGKLWAKSLGFEAESMLFRYGRDKGDYVMMVRQF